MFQDDGAGWMNLLDCEMMSGRTGRTFGGAPSKAANTCSDIRGSEDIYTALVNVPGVNDLEIESIRVIYNKAFAEWFVKTARCFRGNFSTLFFKTVFVNTHDAETC